MILNVQKDNKEEGCGVGADGAKLSGGGVFVLDARNVTGVGKRIGFEK